MKIGFGSQQSKIHAFAVKITRSRTCAGSPIKCNLIPPATPELTPDEFVAALTTGGDANWSNPERAQFYCGSTVVREGSLQKTIVVVDGGKWTFKFKIDASTESLTAELCWTKDETVNGVDVRCSGFAAGESVLVQSGKKTTLKYSFSMTELDAVSGLPVSRCAETTAYLEIQNPTTMAWTTVGEPQPVDFSVVSDQHVVGQDTSGNDILAPFDFDYFGNAGLTGNLPTVDYVHADGHLQPASAKNIMEIDTFPDNDGTYPERAIMQPFQFNDLNAPGTYRVRVQGTIENNVAAVEESFEVSETFTIVNGHTCS